MEERGHEQWVVGHATNKACWGVESRWKVDKWWKVDKVGQSVV